MDTEDRPLVLLITDFRGLIPQRTMSWDGYDLDVLKNSLEQGGLRVRVVGAHEITPDVYQDAAHVAAIYASSQFPRYKQYLQGIIGNLHFAGVQLYPSFEHMLAHEDKAFQAVRLQKAGLGAPRCYIFGDKAHAYEFLKGATYPLVGKTPEGCGSSGVRLIRNEKEGRAFVNWNMIHRVLKKGRPKVVRAFQRVFPPDPSLGCLVFQDYVPGLEGDWKVLIWGDKAHGAHRENRPNDFRASGSGKVAYADVPMQVLEFARTARERLEMHWGSLDIGFDGQQCYLFEYQAVHFGLTVRERGRFYYVKAPDGAWVKYPGRIPLEVEMAGIVVNDLYDRGWL